MRVTKSLLYLALLSPVLPLVLQADAQSLKVDLNADDGSYSLGADGIEGAVLRAAVAAKVNGTWLHASDFPKHLVSHVEAKGALGSGTEWTLRYTGRKQAPDLELHLLAYHEAPYAELQVVARNTSGTRLNMQAVRVLESKGDKLLNLGGQASADRVLSDSFSEDRPAMQLRDLADAEKDVHRAVGVQLIYNPQSRKGWFIGALTSDKFLSVLRLHMAADKSAAMSSYDVDSTGTTELLEENSLEHSPAADRVELSLPLAPLESVASERMLVSIGNDYHKQLETYAGIVRDLHHARVSAPTPLGWWSWTAYYFGLNQGTAMTNAQWLGEHLKPLGYTYFHMDEGYQFARGEYATPDATLFPDGVAQLERGVMKQGLTPGIWTAPFEVSERSYVYEKHPDWLVHNAEGKPIHLGKVTDDVDQLYALDTTNPGAQAYLKQTYQTLVAWGIRYIKMDFMEDSAVEGFYFKPHTTALEAQRIGIQTVRSAVGDDVLLDKDGCELLNPVGLVDMGRISQDTGHTFSSSKDAASGIAARYYMNRNYFLADPDAFSVSTQTVDDQNWHGGAKALTLEEAKVSIALSAVSGGLFEIGDDLPTLGESAERMALVENADLIHMAKLGRASTPVDLMTYSKEDGQPSIFLLKENARETMLTVFNWTDGQRSHSLPMSELGLPEGTYTVQDVLANTDEKEARARKINGTIELSQPAHSVRMLKIVDTAKKATPPIAEVQTAPAGKAGETLQFSAKPASADDAVIDYAWDFGDGVTVAGPTTEHAYTHEGSFEVKLHATGVDGLVGDVTRTVKITGNVSTRYGPAAKRRYQQTSE